MDGRERSRGLNARMAKLRMSLRGEVALGIALVGVVVTVVLFAVTAPQMARSFSTIESGEVVKDVGRLRNAMTAELANLESTAHDWAAWDESAEFVRGTLPTFPEANLMPDTFVNLRLSFMVFFDSADRVVYAKSYNLEGGEAPSPRDFLTAAVPVLALWQSVEDTSSRAGILAFGDRLAFTAIHPVTTSFDEPPAVGRLAIGRIVDATEVARLASQIRLPLEVRSIGDPRNTADLMATLAGGAPAVVPLNSETVAGYTMWEDLLGRPVAVLGVEIPRDAYRAGITATRNLRISIMALFAGLATAFLYFLDRRVLSRMARMTHDVVRIAEVQDTSRRVWVAGKDELAQLGTNINGMLASIEESRAALAKSERQYHNLFESSRDPIYITTEDGRFIDVNPAFVDLLGYTKEEVMTKTAGEFYVHPEDRDAFQAAIAKSGFVTSFPVTLKRKDGVQLRCLLTTALEAPSGSEERVYQGIIRDVTELLRQQEQVAFLAAHDPLTGLLSRGALYDVLRLEIARAMRNLDRLAVFYLDLDRFKEVNDTHGHAAGDHVLQEVSVRLRDVLRASDTVARLGGDEFVALLPGIDSPRDAEIAADKILQALRDSFEIPEDGSFDLSASIGIALFPDDGESGAHLLQRADAAMYVAKAEGRDGWRRYSRGAQRPSQS